MPQAKIRGTGGQPRVLLPRPFCTCALLWGLTPQPLLLPKVLHLPCWVLGQVSLWV